MPRPSLVAVTSSLTLTLMLAAGCTIKVGDLGELTQSGSDTAQEPPGSSGPADTGDATSAATTDATDTEDSTTGEPQTPADGVDILFIIDNSGSMAAHQQRLVDGIPALVDPLLAAGLDLRIAVTTTDTGNPRCPTTTPERGAFQAKSCRAGVPANEWTYADEDFAAACLGGCALETLELSPTTTAADPVAKVRPWIEWDGVTGNVAAPLGQALGCMLPQGVAGCGFESPLEALRLALTRAQTPDDPQFGFLRASADLQVVIVTDEMDCSHNPAFDEIFKTNKVYWNHPDDPQPTSGMCWRAGVQCSGGPEVFDDCVPADHDVGGGLTQDPTQAVLFPMARYHDAIAAIRADKLAAGSTATVRLASIVGVPVGYSKNPLVYEKSSDPNYQHSFGVAPGCVAGDGAAAVPPLRLLELSGGTYSICEPSFMASLAAISADILFE